MANANDATVLRDQLISTLTLLSQFTSSMGERPAATTRPVPDHPNPLHVVRDAAKLLKAHITKLSLLAINKPFTPSAVTKVLRDLSSTCLPAMMSAVQISSQEHATWGTLVSREVELRVLRVFRETETLVKEVQAINAGGGSSSNVKRDSLASTGVVWESCDALVELEKSGLAGLAVQKAEQWRDTIKDAIEELREWCEGEDLDHEGHEDELLDSDDEGVAGDSQTIEDIFNAANSLPKDRPELKRLAEEAQGKLKKVVILYNALIKRRLRTFGAAEGEGVVTTLDSLMAKLKVLPHRVDELASNLYDLDEDRARQTLGNAIRTAKDAASLAAKAHDGRDDEFTAWSRKWQEAVG